MNKPFDFWQDHSDIYLEMAFRTDREERISNPDAGGKKIGDCGDNIEIFFVVNDDRIEDVSFTVDGCLNTRACANTVAQLAKGKSIDEAWEINPTVVSDYLETLPPNEHHCAELAVGALYLALADYQSRRP